MVTKDKRRGLSRPLFLLFAGNLMPMAHPLSKLSLDRTAQRNRVLVKQPNLTPQQPSGSISFLTHA
jgi:hypothetical protein